MFKSSPAFTLGIPVEQGTVFNILEMAGEDGYTLPADHLVTEVTLDGLFLNDVRLALWTTRELGERRSHDFEFSCSSKVDDKTENFTVVVNAQTGELQFESAYTGKFQLILSVSAYATVAVRPE